MGNDELMDGVKQAIGEFQALVDLAYSQFSVFVDDVISGRLTNIYTIERTMDYMVDFGFDERIETIYKKLCRFLYPQYPKMVTDHVKFYLETNREDEDMADNYVEFSFKVDRDLYDEVKAVLEPLGLTVDRATELFFEAVARFGKIPFDYSAEDIAEAKSCCKVQKSSVYEDIKTGLEQAIEYERQNKAGRDDG